MTVFASIYPELNLKFQLIGTFLATIGYGIVLALFFASMFYHIRSSVVDGRCRRASGSPPPSPVGPSSKFRFFKISPNIMFMSFMIIMVLICTLTLAIAIILTMDVVSPSRNSAVVANKMMANFLKLGEVITLVLASWASDLLMIWRCLVIYQGISRQRHILFSSLLILLVSASFGTGITYIVRVRSSTVLEAYLFMMAFAVQAALTNTVITTLIVVRLRSHYHSVTCLLGTMADASPYRKLAHMFIESAALIILFNIAHCGLASRPKYSLILSHPLLVQIYTIASLLILFRAARNRSHTRYSHKHDTGTHLSFSRSTNSMRVSYRGNSMHQSYRSGSDSTMLDQ